MALIERMKLFLKDLGYTEEYYFNNINEINRLYMRFTDNMEELYLKEKEIKRIYDFNDFDSYCCNYLINKLKEDK